MIELRVSEAAATAIVEQADYYSQASGVSLARRWEDAVDRAVRSLLNSPERGALCHFRAALLSDVRWIPIPKFPKHMIFYRYAPDDSAIQIVHVLHGARNLESILSEETHGRLT